MSGNPINTEVICNEEYNGWDTIDIVLIESKKKKTDKNRYEANKEYYMNKGIQYYKDHREEILKKGAVKMTCPICHRTYRKSSNYEHLISQIHLKYLLQTKLEKVE